VKKFLNSTVDWLACRRFNWIDAIALSAQTAVFIHLRQTGTEFFPALGMAVLVGLPLMIISVWFESMDRKIKARENKAEITEMLEALARLSKGERRD